MRWPIVSSVVKAAGYDPERHVLEVEFPSGDVYRYVRVEPRVFHAFMTADSKGRFFNERIREAYEGERVE